MKCEYFSFVPSLSVRTIIFVMRTLILQVGTFNPNLINKTNAVVFQFSTVVVHKELRALQSACAVLVRENKVYNTLLYSLAVFCTNLTFG